MAQVRGNLRANIAAQNGFIGTDPMEAVFVALAPAVLIKYLDTRLALQAVDHAVTLKDWIRSDFLEPDRYNRERPAFMVQETSVHKHS